jgi:hypothetical protein
VDVWSKGLEQPGINTRLNGGPGTNQAYLAKVGLFGQVVNNRTNDVENGDVAGLFANGLIGPRRSGIAGDNDKFGTAAAKISSNVSAKIPNVIGAFVAIGHVQGIADVLDIGLGEGVAKGFEDG